MTDYADEVAARVDAVFTAHPELRDHRREHPWLVGWLGDVTAQVWLVAENPSATQVDRIHSSGSTPEAQWAASSGDLLLREALVEHGLKSGGPLSAGEWHCYITNVMKSEVFVKDWNGTAKGQRLAVAEMWAPVLRFELEFGRPKKLVVLGANAYEALRHVERQGLVPQLPPLERLHHYSYVMMRPDTKRKLGPGDPLRQAEWREALGAANRA